MSSNRDAACGKLRGRQRRGVQCSVLQNVDGAVVGKNGNLGAPVAVPDEIA